MANYTDELAEEYASKRVNYRATEKEVFTHVDRIGLSEKRVLDFGCGDGVYVPEFLKRGAFEVIGIDDSPKMIELAQKQHGALKNVQFVESDGSSLPFGANEFDFVFANLVLHHFVDLMPPLKEIYRVLKSGGVILATMGAYNIPDGVVVQEGQYMPIKLRSQDTTTLVHNVMRSYKSVERNFKNVGFKIKTLKTINNANASMDDSHPYKDQVTLLTVLVVAQK